MRAFLFSFLLLFPASLLVGSEVKQVVNYPDSDYVIVGDNIYTFASAANGIVFWEFDNEQEAQAAYTAASSSVSRGCGFYTVRSGACDVVAWYVSAFYPDYANFLKIYSVMQNYSGVPKSGQYSMALVGPVQYADDTDDGDGDDDGDDSGDGDGEDDGDASGDGDDQGGNSSGGSTEAEENNPPYHGTYIRDSGSYLYEAFWDGSGFTSVDPSIASFWIRAYSMEEVEECKAIWKAWIYDYFDGNTRWDVLQDVTYSDFYVDPPVYELWQYDNFDDSLEFVCYLLRLNQSQNENEYSGSLTEVIDNFRSDSESDLPGLCMVRYGLFRTMLPIGGSYGSTSSGVSMLSGQVLASGSDSVEGTTNLINDNIVFTQAVTTDIESEPEDLTGTSDVSVQTTSSESDSNITIINNTEVNTNLELGNAPDDVEYEKEFDPEEKDVEEFSERYDNSEPEFVYVEKYGDGYRINYGKLWDDVEGALNSFLPFEAIKSILAASGSASLPVVPIQASFPEVGFYFDYSIDFNEVFAHEFLQILRNILTFFIIFETVVLCVVAMR